MNADEYQQMLDENFPDGAVVTIDQHGDEDLARRDTVPQEVIDFFRVVEVDEDEMVTISMKVSGAYRDIVATIEDFRPREYGFWAITDSEDAPNFLISRNLSDEQRQAIQSERAEEEDDE